MCGIVGYVGQREVVPLILNGLRSLEYRGYDSAGVVVLRDGELEAVKAEGKLDRLIEKLEEQPLGGAYGLGHTRWATHGVPSERNAHPVVDAKQRVALIHNGIIENFLPLKEQLIDQGWQLHLRHRHRSHRQSDQLLSRGRPECRNGQDRPEARRDVRLCGGLDNVASAGDRRGTPRPAPGARHRRG